MSALCSTIAFADLPRLVHYQGKLVTNTGAIVAGPVSIRARLYDSSTALTPVLFDETHTGVGLNRGLFSVLLGSQTGSGVPDSVFNGSSVYLGIAVDGAAELDPRIRIASAPFSAKTRSAERLVRPNSSETAVSVDASGRVGVGTASPSDAASLDVASTSGGFLPPRMTTAQRNAIANPITGLQIFNLDNNCLEFYIGDLWQSLVCGCAAPPASPLAIDGPDVVCEAQTGVVYSITPIFGATSYDWSVPPGAVINAGDGTPSITVDFGAPSGSVIVAARNACGASADRVYPVTVNLLPDPAFTYTPPTAYEGAPVSFSPVVSGASYAWTFENGTPADSTAESPTVTWTSTGTHEISLTVTENGCSDSSTQSISIIPALASCAAILSANPGALSGGYGIDPDGAGGSAPFGVYCDMTTDGGGWTIVTAHAAIGGQPTLTSDTEAAGNAIAYQTFNINRTKKELISAISTTSLMKRASGPWIRVNRALFDDSLVGAGDQHPHYSVTVTASNGSSASNCQMGYSNFNNNGGADGDFGINTGGGSFDHCNTVHYHLNCGCANMYFYGYGSNYNANTGLGAWTATDGCSSGSTAMGGWYAAMR